MSSGRVAGSRRIVADHFEPDEADDPKAQRQLRGHLEQIDYTAYAANRKVLAATVGRTDARRFQRLGMAAAEARARWIATALAATERGQTPPPDQIEKLTQLRATYEELTEVYEAMRRMVERGYLVYAATPAQKA
jgi:hypothetical protein